ncbi:MAG: glycosyltransferase family 2 protein [Bacteroidales bacterium]|nr:glycosyltransferase family 2 protein [Bacteroidales bacterium]
MPCYNMEKFIAYTIQSVQGQTYPHWELLIVDDASTDKTAEIVKNIQNQDDRIHFIIKSKHSGIADTRNQCLNMAKGRFLAFLDADDLWHPGKLEQQLQFMTERNIGFSYSSYDCVDEAGKSLEKIVKATGNLNYEAYLRNTIIGCSTIMIDKTIVGEVIVPNFRTSEDTATWLNILKKGFLAYAIDQPLTSYRIRQHSASSNKLKASTDLWRVYRQNEKLPLFKALVCFSSYAFNAIKKRL